MAGKVRVNVPGTTETRELSGPVIRSKKMESDPKARYSTLRIGPVRLHGQRSTTSKSKK